LVSVVLLDASPLGILANPRRSPQIIACRQWVAKLQVAGSRVIVPEIADYEVRRELLLRNSINGLSNLDWLGQQLEFLPLNSAALRKAAEFWASARRAGIPTASSAELDADVILAAQAVTLGEPTVIVATANVGHLARFVAADHWQNIV
jgi:predicted nucleic acid-binding protein